MTGLESQTRDLASKHSSLGQSLQGELAASERRVSDLKDELAAAKRRQEQHTQANDDLKTRLAEERQAREEAVRQSASKCVSSMFYFMRFGFTMSTYIRDSSISNLADSVSSLEKQVAQMTAEKDDLLVKIEAGEGANTALTQLKQENVSGTVKLLVP